MCFECDITLESVYHIKIRVLVLKCKGEKTYTELHIQSEREAGCFNNNVKVGCSKEGKIFTDNSKNHSVCFVGHAVAQDYSHQPLISEAWVWSQAGWCGTCDRKISSLTGFSNITLVLPCHYHSKNASYSFIYQSLMYVVLAVDHVIK